MSNTDYENINMQSYGSWHSPISAEHLVQDTLRFGQIAIDGTSFYYTEGRPTEKGRSVLMQGALQGEHRELLPKEFNVRTRVHEYGGKCILAHHKTVYFVNESDQDLYKISDEGVITRITHEPTLHFADLSIGKDASFLYAVAERHEQENVENFLVQISLHTYEIKIIASGYDFYAAPRVSPDGSLLAWFCWNHPNMPWDGTELWMGELSPKGLLHTQKIAGNLEESITLPVWSDKNILYFVSDQTGYWNIYQYHNSLIQSVYSCDIEFGAPHWIFGVERYCILEDDTLIAIGTTQGKDALYHINPLHHSLQRLDTPFTSISDLYLIEDTLIFNGASPSLPHSLMSLNLSTQKITVLKQSQKISIDPAYISVPQDISFLTEGGLTAYGFYYPPTHKNCIPYPNTTPPLIVRCHGGPTAHVSPKLNLEILYFTSRGFAFFEINYGGSSGYGREYRNRLRGQWGVVDVQDCLHAAHYLCNQGLANSSQLIIKGGSAGGFTTLSVLAASKTFKAGASYYGVSDLELLMKDTHKMELHYLDHLIGPYSKYRQTYINRSPIHHVQKLSQPIIFFQGTEDHVVPPAQSEKMYQALCNNKIPTAYLLFQHEAHGFRRSETIKRCIEIELMFYSQIFHLNVSDTIPSPDTLEEAVFLSSDINF